MLRFNRNNIESNENSSSMIVPDVLDQIKKRTEELSTSEASMKLLQNLSNPTNLTNPLIINTFNHRKNQKINYALPSLVNRRNINKKNNINYPNKILYRSNSDILTRNSINSFTHDLFDLSNYQNLIQKAEESVINNQQEKNRKKKFLAKINQSIDINNKNNKNRIINDKSVNYDDIWEKLKNGKSFLNINKEKDLRININKFLPKRQAIEKSNYIRLINYSNKNKDERFKKILTLKRTQMKSTDDIIKKLESSKDFLGNKYKEEYKSYIRFLNKKFEEESFTNDDIIKEKNILLHDIDKLKRNIEKITKTKHTILGWLYLQIQVKERKSTLPVYYKYIIEDNYPYEKIKKIVKGKYNLNINDYNKIKNYKTNYVYEDAQHFFKDLEEIEMKSLNKLDKKLEINNEIIIMKEELQELKLENVKITTRFNENYNELIENLNYIQKDNRSLELRLIQVKSKKTFEVTYKNIYLLNKLALYAKMNANKNTMNFILKNDKPTIFYITMCLYNILIMREYPELKDKKIKFNWDKGDEYNMMLIFHYAEEVINILKKEKDYYFSNKILREEYKKMLADIDKEAKKERATIKLKMQKKLEMEKIEKFKQKINKKYYKPNRKIDFDYYRKEGKNKNKSLDLDVKREKRFEDFLYDIYS